MLIIAEGRTIEIVQRAPSAASMIVSVSEGGDSDGTFELASWRPLSYGFSAEVFYFWSARQLIALPRSRAVVRYDLDDDLQYVFTLGSRWLVVLESSVRVLDDAGSVLSRFEFGEVVSAASWDGSALSVQDITGVRRVLTIDGDELIDATSS